jgi:outer membrane lipoprotein carrier protein
MLPECHQPERSAPPVAVILRIHVSSPRRVTPYVNRLPFLVCLLAAAPAFADAGLERMLKGIEDHYNHAKTLQVLFTEEYTAEGRSRRPESGLLLLRKPGRMRWDYTAPAGKLFVSDGKTVYLYSPDAHRVERAPLKASEDMRAPLAFLLGKLDFSREFKDFQTRLEGADTVLTAFANSDKLPYAKVEMLVNPGFEIHRLVVTGTDQSVLTFTFAGEKVNPKVDDSVFRFHTPPGATEAEAETQ